MGAILVGTSGYSYDDWVGPVYPPGTAKRDFLHLYASRFSFTELNFSFYRLPTAEGLSAIASKVPASFHFVVKAHRSLTHDRAHGWERDAARFGEAAAGGIAQDQLAGVLLQFPFSFHYTDPNRRYLASLADSLSSLPLFVEFRNAEWDQESVWRELDRRDLGVVIPDMPKLDGLPRTPPMVTGTRAYLRFHGRNAANWWEGTNITRYDYSYSEDELREWLDPIETMSARSETMVIAFNNHFAGQAVTNAEQLMKMLGLGPAA